MSRYSKIVLEAERGIILVVSEENDGELIVKAQKLSKTSSNIEFPIVVAGEYAPCLSLYRDKAGRKAIIPPGWTVSGLEKENTIFGKNVGLVIYKINKEDVEEINWANDDEVEFLKRTCNQFVWVPVSLIDADGTIDGFNFNQKFGRRDYFDDKFGGGQFHESFVGELLMQFESVKRYGGFYISRYDISKSLDGKPYSVKAVKPWVRINFEDARAVASTIENTHMVMSHLTFGAEYDSVLAWLISSRTKTLDEIADDSSKWGNYWNSNRKTVLETGSREEWSANNIYDLAGNVDEWTQEEAEKSYHIIRGGFRCAFGFYYPVSFRYYSNSLSGYNDIGFRAALLIK